MRGRLVIAAALLLTVAGSVRGQGPDRYQVEDRRSGYLYMGDATRALQDDDFVNPGFFAVERGRELWNTVIGSAAKSCASCHADATQSMRGVGARYPVFDEKKGGLVNLELRINEMRTVQMGAPALPYESDDLVALTAYVATQSRGMPMDVAIEGLARPFFEAGRDYYFKRRGQLDLSCSQCHDDNAGKMLRGDLMSQGQVNGFPIYRLMWREAASRHRMFQWCNWALRAEPSELGSDEYLALELYVAWRGRGLPVETPAIRR